MINAPGCYGISVVCETNKKVCRACPVHSPCRAEATANMKNVIALTGDQPNEFAKILGVAPGSSNAKSSEVSEDELALLATLSGKARQVAESMCQKGVNPKYALQSGINPFVRVKPGYMRPVFELLLNGRRITRVQMAQAIHSIDKGWGPKTIASHVSTAIRILEAFKCIKRAGNEVYEVNRDFS